MSLISRLRGRTVRAPAVVAADVPAGDGPEAEADAGIRHVTLTSGDGLRLHAADYGDPVSPWLPLVCIPGLARTTRDFHDLAIHLSTHRHRPRRVIAIDGRGHGLSEWDPNTGRYSLLAGVSDVLDAMAALGIPRAFVMGTSRGGLIAMMMAVARPNAVSGVILNDIGPVIDPYGFARLKSAIEHTPVPDNWDDAAALLKRVHEARFPGFAATDWDHLARLTWRDAGGTPVADHDPALARAFDGVDFDRPLPDLWPEFRSLAPLPVLAIRGETSDVLSAVTVAEMESVHPGLETLTMAGEGHPPMLRRPLVGRVSAFLTRAEGNAPPIDAILPRSGAAFDLEREAEAEPEPETGEPALAASSDAEPEDRY